MMFVHNADVCGFCRKPVALSDPAIEALNRTYHDGCFQCRSCHIPLAGKQYYNKAGIPLCEDCYQVGHSQYKILYRVLHFEAISERVCVCVLGQLGALLGMWGGHHRSHYPCTRASIPPYLFHLYDM